MPTALDDLNSLLTPEEQAQFSTLLKNPKFAEATATRAQFFKDYAEFVEPSTKNPETPVVTPTPPAAPTAPTTPAAPAPTAVTPKTSATSDLSAISALLDTKLTELRKEFVPAADVGKFRTEILSNAIKLSDDYASVREAHREEFGERLNRPEFEKFVADAGGRYPSMLDAHNAFVNDKRIELRVKKGVEEGLKLKTSSTTVPAQTTATALSPAQEIIRKAKSAESGNGETNVSRAAARLSKLMKDRDNSEAA
jgi:hypothetical protein